MSFAGDTHARFRVLVVDDDVDFARCVIEALELDDCEVASAANAADAIRLAKELRPNAVLLDVGLPDADGYAVARELRSSTLPRPATIVMLTGTPARQLAPTEPPEVDLTLTKPTELDRLSSLLRHVHGLRLRGVAPSGATI